MSRLLSELLAAEEPLFSSVVKKLELAAGQQSVDVQLTADIAGKVQLKLRALGLDPTDTTGTELYWALYGLFGQHDNFLATRIGIADPSDSNEVLRRVVETVRALDIPRQAWLLKPSVAKRLLKQSPPKKVMKALGYRSIDSLIKREQMPEIYAVMQCLESETWLKKFRQKYKALRSTDFETRTIEVLYISSEKWGKSVLDYVKKHRHNVTYNHEIGAVAVMPMPPVNMQGLTTITFAIVLHYVHEIRTYATFFKSQQVSPDFASILIKNLTEAEQHHAHIAGQPIHWRIIQRHMSRADSDIVELFEPYITLDDISWRRAEQVLYQLEPALHFWHDLEYVGASYDGGVVSFNLMDMAINYVNKLPYGKHSVSHLRQSLWSELYARYLQHEVVERQVMAQLQQDSLLL